jgi:integrase
LREREKVIALCRHAWKVVHRLYPDQFDRDVPNPWMGVTKKRRAMKSKKAATREQVYAFARKAIELGYGEAAGAAVICFEWLQRPENVLAGFVRSPDYRPAEKPTFLRIERGKTGAVVWHPLEEEDGTPFYPGAEAVLAQVPRRGVPMILRRTPSGTFKPYNAMEMARVVRRVRAAAGLPDWFTPDSCRHGGMTEIEAAGLTDAL